MKKLMPLLALFVFSACEQQDAAPPLPVTGSSVAVASTIPGVRDAASKRELTAATVEAHQAITGSNWRTATAALDRLREANRDAAWMPQFEMAMGNLLLATHFAHRDALTAEQADVAGRYTDVLLGLDGVRSDALNRTVVALKPHWSAQRFGAAATKVLARSAEGNCDGCEALPPEVAAELREGLRAEASSAAGVREAAN